MHSLFLPDISCTHIRQEESTGGNEVHHQELLTFMIHTEKYARCEFDLDCLNLTMSLI